MRLLFVSALSFLSIHAMAINPADSLPSDVKAKHLSFSNNECYTDMYSDSEVYPLANGAKLYIVPCVMGAYQGSSYAYTVDKFNSINPVLTLSFNEMINGLSASFEHGDASYDAKKKVFSTFAKGRGIGDCGQSSQSKISVDEYGYVGVKTIQVRSKSKCDGKMNSWPVIFSQK